MTTRDTFQRSLLIVLQLVTAVTCPGHNMHCFACLVTFVSHAHLGHESPAPAPGQSSTTLRQG